MDTDDLVDLPMQQVYVIEKTIKHVKIGVSVEFERRKRTIETQGGFKALRSFSSREISNGYKIESLIHKKFEESREIGEWFHISFEDAQWAALEICEEYGNKIPKHYSRKAINNFTGTFFQLPTAMEELEQEDPFLHDWFVKNGYALEYGHHIHPAYRNTMVVIGDFGNSNIMRFDLFAAITMSELKNQTSLKRSQPIF